MTERRFLWWLAIAAASLRLRWAVAVSSIPLLFACFFVLMYPVVSPTPLAQPAFNVDAAEGKVWVNSEVVLEVRGRLSEEQVLESLRFDPSVKLSAGDVTIEHLARLPLHESFPWATTRVTVNPERVLLFQPETKYSLALEEATVSFETITLPVVVAVQADQDPSGKLDAVPTSRDILVVFNESVEWDPSLLQIEPPAEAQTKAESLPDGKTVVRIVPPGRWENSTTYTLRIMGAVEDLYGHEGDLVFEKQFTTWPQPHVTAAAPQGESQPVESVLRIEFERPADRATVEQAFRIEPAVGGAFEWESDQVLHWRPQALQHSTWYKAAVGGIAAGGDTIVPLEWSFRTHDPPVSVEIKGRDDAPTLLEAIPNGGLGNYAIQWSTGQTEREILFQGSPEGPQTVEVAVQSGDRTAIKAIQVSAAPPGFAASGCPEGWDMIEVSLCYRSEELPGPVRTFVARIDLKDPRMQPRSVPGGDKLGATRTTSEGAKASKSLVAVNGDFFYEERRGSFTLGPIAWGGNFAYAPTSSEVVLALGRDRSAWVGPAGELRFGVQSADGSAIALHGVNHEPPENAAALFNGHWGQDLTLGFDGCYAIIYPAGGQMRTAHHFACSPIAAVPLWPGAYVVVGRGAAAEWLQQQSQNPLSVSHSFPVRGLDFMVGGSHILVQNGEKPHLNEDRRNPRTAIGIDGDRFLYLLVVDGRSEESLGMTLPELQGYVAGLGLKDAINLDGGGSSTLVVGESVVTKPSEGNERPVANIVEVGRSLPVCGHSFVRC